MKDESPCLASLEIDGWALIDAVRAYQSRERVYWIAPLDQRPPLVKGTLVKLIFKWAKAATEGYGAERMWAEVAHSSGSDVHAHLANDPFHPEAPLRCGDGLWFRQEHVVDVIAPGGQAISESAETVTCDCHGLSERCYVCVHLIEAENAGFHDGGTHKLRPDACPLCQRG